MTKRVWIGVAVLLLCSSAASAQDEKGWVDVNFGAAKAAAETYSRSISFRLFSETATFGADYDFPTGGYFDVGGGYMFTPVVGIGVSLEGRAHEGAPTISARVPHPFTFNAPGTDSREGDTPLSRREASVNFQIMLNATPNSENFRLRVFAGPSFYRVEQEAVSDVIYRQVAPIFTRINQITITNYQFKKIDGTGWGFHGGADVSYYFTRVVGIGGMVKFSRATVTLEDVVGEYDSKAGGAAFGGGLRLKF